MAPSAHNFDKFSLEKNMFFIWPGDGFPREDVVAELILMVNSLYRIMSVAMLNFDWCLALRSVPSTSWVCPK